MKLIDPLINKLWTTAQTHAESLGYEFTIACEYHVKDFVSHGVEKLRQEFGGDIPDAQERLVESNLLRFVTAMTEYAASQGVTELHEDSFFNIRNVLCPLYPFC